jgi:Ferritin-like domain
MKQFGIGFRHYAARRRFLKNGLLAAGAATVGALLLGKGLSAFGQEEKSGHLPPGDAAILRFLAAAEIIETDLWVQYAELGGTQDSEIPGLPTGGNPLYTAALQLLDGDMPQYIHDNTDDEITHQRFINAYLHSKGADTVDLSQFATIPGSTAKGSKGKKRLTNLTELNVDTSFWTRYRSDKNNPDLDPNFVFPQAVEIKNRTAIPRDDGDTHGSFIDNAGVLHATDHLKAIAFTAGFHFAFIEQGGTSLYPSLAQRVTSAEVLRILLSIGPTETMHFQTWQDKAGNANSGNPPLTDVDRTGASVTFTDLTANPSELLHNNLIMPEPTFFLSRKFPLCSIIRPTETKGAAMGAVKALTADGLFMGQKDHRFSDLLNDLAEDADEAQRQA